MTSLLGMLHNVDDEHDVRLTKFGWCMLVCVLWGTIGLLYFAIEGLYSVLQYLADLNTSQWIALVFVCPGFVALFALVFVWITLCKNIFETYRRVPKEVLRCPECDALCKPGQTNCMSCGQELEGD